MGKKMKNIKTSLPFVREEKPTKIDTVFAGKYG